MYDKNLKEKLQLIVPNRYNDGRGFFAETYSRQNI